MLHPGRDFGSKWKANPRRFDEAVMAQYLSRLVLWDTTDADNAVGVDSVAFDPTNPCLCHAATCSPLIAVQKFNLMALSNGLAGIIKIQSGEEELVNQTGAFATALLAMLQKHPEEQEDSSMAAVSLCMNVCRGVLFICGAKWAALGSLRSLNNIMDCTVDSPAQSVNGAIATSLAWAPRRDSALQYSAGNHKHKKTLDSIAVAIPDTLTVCGCERFGARVEAFQAHLHQYGPIFCG